MKETPFKEILSDEEISHPLNEALLKEAEEIKGERRTLKERLEKLDQSAQGVSSSVYQKVRSDYLERLKASLNRLSSLKDQLDREEKGLIEKKELVEANIRFHREKMEESRLRQELGEFTAEEHEALIEKEDKEISRLEGALKVLEEGLDRHRQILEGEEITPAPAAPTRVTKPTEVQAKPPEVQKAVQKNVKDVSETLSQKTSRIVLPEAKIPQILVWENGKVIQTVPLDKTIVIGRSPASDIVLKEAKVSRKHAEIQCAGGRYVLLDLESSNGTFVAGRRVTEYSLQPDDEITIGNTKMVFKVS